MKLISFKCRAGRVVAFDRSGRQPVAWLRLMMAMVVVCAMTAPSAGHAAPTPVTVAVEHTAVGTDRIAPAGTVEVFSNSAIYLTNTRDARVYLLDALEVLDRELSAGLPANEREAQAMVRRRLQGMGTAKLAERTRLGAEGIVQAARYGIDRVPAVVVNGEAVIYGVTDIDAARGIYQRRQRKQ